MVEKLIYNRTNVIKNALSTILLILIFAIEGCFNFLTFEFNYKLLLNVGFWVQIGIKILLLNLVKIWVMSIFLNIARIKNVDLNYNKKVNDKLMQSKDNDFPNWVENVENREIRVEFFKSKINKKLAKLESKAKPKDRMLYYSDREHLKSTNRYCRKKKELEYFLTNEYINKNIDYLMVKNCPKIDAAVFDCPITNENIAIKYQLSARTKSAIFTSLLVASCMFFIIQTIWNSIELFRNDEPVLSVLATLIMDAVFLLWQALTGINTAFNIIESQEVLPYVNRNRILEKYLYYKNPDKIEATKKYLIEMKKECKDESKN